MPTRSPICAWQTGTSHPSGSLEGQHPRCREITVDSSKQDPGDGMTIQGTTVFTATALLRATAEHQTIARTFEQDVESLAYVVIYSLYKRALRDPQVTRTTETKLAEEFENLFGATTVKNLLDRRQETFLIGNIRQRFPLLRGYLLQDLPLSICAIATSFFLSHLNAPQPVQAPLNEAETIVYRSLRPMNQPIPLPFEEAYRGWVRALRLAAFHAAGGEGDEEEWLRVHFGEDLQ